MDKNSARVMCILVMITMVIGLIAAFIFRPMPEKVVQLSCYEELKR